MGLNKTTTEQFFIYDKIWQRDEYLAKINPAQIHRRRMLKSFLKHLKINPKRVLDIGCGTGELLSELSNMYPEAKLLGCDLSSESDKLMKSIIPDSDFFQIDIEESQSIPSNILVDLITCSEVLEHCSNPNNVVTNAFNWLNTGGVFFVTVPSGNMTAYDRSVGHVHHFTTEEIKSILHSKGFKNTNAVYWGAPFHTLYRKIVEIASNNMEKEKKELNDQIIPIWIFSRIFNVLFYMNWIKNSGCQIFAWGYK